jgi:hypothetical protein
MAELYLQAGDIACDRKRVTVSVNGKVIPKCIRAKSGKNGFVEFYLNPLQLKNCDALRGKMRGNVKISMSPR